MPGLDMLRTGVLLASLLLLSSTGDQPQHHLHAGRGRFAYAHTHVRHRQKRHAAAPTTPASPPPAPPAGHTAVGSIFLRPELVDDCVRTDAESYERYLVGGCGRPTADGFPAQLPQDLLDASILHLGGQRVQALVDKLQAGRPIAVVAIGGSVTRYHGGCWGGGCYHICTGPEEANRCHETSRPYFIHPEMENSTGFMEPSRPVYGQFLTRLMQWVNMTFPHPDHLAVNRGLAGHGAGSFLGMTDEELLLGDREVDLVLMDHAVNNYEAEPTLRLLSRMMDARGRPAVVMVNFLDWCRGRSGGPCGKRVKKKLDWIRALVTKGPDEWQRDITRLSHEWDLANLSLLHAIGPLLLTNPPAPQIWPLKKITDGVHAEVAEHGLQPYAIYMGDMAIHWLRSAVGAGPEKLAGSLDADSRPVFSDAITQVVKFEFGVHRPPVVVETGNLGWQTLEIPEHYSAAMPAEFSGGWFHVEHPLDGSWRVLERHKPGLVSVAVGDVVVLSLPSHDAPFDPLRITNVTVTFLQSYEHMGLVELSCTSGCTCGPVEVDGHTDIHYSGSEAATFPIRLLQADCALSLENKPRAATSAGEGRQGQRLAKFKVESITLGTAVDHQPSGRQ